MEEPVASPDLAGYTGNFPPTVTLLVMPVFPLLLYRSLFPILSLLFFLCYPFLLFICFPYYLTCVRAPSSSSRLHELLFSYLLVSLSYDPFFFYNIVSFTFQLYRLFLSFFFFFFAYFSPNVSPPCPTVIHLSPHLPSHS